MIHIKDVIDFLQENKEKLIFMETSTDIENQEENILRYFSDKEKSHGYLKSLATKNFEFEIEECNVKMKHEDDVIIKSMISDLMDFDVTINSFSINPLDKFAIDKEMISSVRNIIKLNYTISFVTYYVDDEIVDFPTFMKREDEYLKYYFKENNLI